MIEILKDYLQTNNFWDTIRRLDDKIIKSELENEFFKDLKKWYYNFNQINFEIFDHKSKEELIVLFLNKIVFIRTLEDYGLIPYKFIEEKYFQAKEHWEIKGRKIVFDNFFNEIENWFYTYYDTELFKVKIWDYIKKDVITRENLKEPNLEPFQNIFERVMGFGKWEYKLGKGMIHYNYRKIDEDVFGKAYETFIAEEKKDAGIFYTPKSLTNYMSEKIVKNLFQPFIEKIIKAIENEDIKLAKKNFIEMKKIKIIDPSSGSGSFLIKVFREIYKFYCMLEAPTDWVLNFQKTNMFSNVPKIVKDTKEFRKFILMEDESDRRKLLASIILNHIFAIDIDERALETAKTNIWKEAIKVEPTIFSFRKLPETDNYVLPNLQMNFISADALYDLDIEKQVEILKNEFSNEIKKLCKIRANYLKNSNQPKLLEPITEIKNKIRNRLNEEIEIINKPTFIALEFFYCFFDEKGKLLKKNKYGFSGIISNPPWEALKPVKKEFANIEKYGTDILDFNKWFKKKLKSDEIFKKNWENYENFYLKYGQKIKEIFKFQGVGDSNLYKLFIEKNFNLVRENANILLLVPSGIQTDKGCKDLRKLIIENNNLKELLSFENRGYFENKDDRYKTKLFPDVDSRFKYTIINAEKKQSSSLNYNFESCFYMQDPKELYERERIIFNAKKIKHFSKENFSIMEFKKKIDYNLCDKILGEHKLLGETNFILRSEFHMTNDSYLFEKEELLKNKKKYCKLYEGKMMHQFNSNFNGERYLIKKEKAYEILKRKEIKRINKISKKTLKKQKKIFENEDFKLDFENVRLVYRAIAGSTNERSLISCIIPKNVFCGNSVVHLVNFSYEKNENKILQKKVKEEDLLFLMSLFNSLTLNYYIRNKISANLTMNYIYELPIPNCDALIKKSIIEKSFHLLYSKSKSSDFECLKNTLNFDKKAIDEIFERASLEVLIAKNLFSLNKEEFIFLCSTFIYGKSASKKELDEIIKKSIEIY